MITTLKTCFKCGAEKPRTDFYKHSKMGDGLLGKCKECTKADVKNHKEENIKYVLEYDRNRPNARERTRLACDKVAIKRREDVDYAKHLNKAAANSSSKYPDKVKARTKLSNALRDGRIQRKTCCEHCSETSSTIEGHHWSYEIEYALDVIWLCTECHGKEHKRINRCVESGDDPYPTRGLTSVMQTVKSTI